MPNGVTETVAELFGVRGSSSSEGFGGQLFLLWSTGYFSFNCGEYISRPVLSV